MDTFIHQRNTKFAKMAVNTFITNAVLCKKKSKVKKTSSFRTEENTNHSDGNLLNAVKTDHFLSGFSTFERLNSQSLSDKMNWIYNKTN